VLAHSNLCNVERVYLMTTHQQQFYEHIGFEQNASTTLVLCNQNFEGDFDSDRQRKNSALLHSKI
jgi:N-acetylglutamate synthase-like GNAT family acetyltransferase